MKTICIIQPYIFPYLPYYQLVAAVNECWILDDVQFIRKGGWMNRNYILVGGRKHLFTLPVSAGRLNDLILEKTLPHDFARSLTTVTTTIRQAYTKAPHGNCVFHMFDKLICQSWTRFIDFSMAALRLSCGSLGIQTPFHMTSSLGLSRTLKGSERILAVCERTAAGHYVNPIGGMALYDPGMFLQVGVRLSFLRGECLPYPQSGTVDFTSGLSILDMMANLGTVGITGQLENFKLIR